MRRYRWEAVVNDATRKGSDVGRPLRTISEIRSFFRINVRPIFFVGPTAFNLLGIDRWVRNFRYLVYYDSWDGAHPLVFSPRNKPFVEFESSEDINNYLLRDPEVQAHVSCRVRSSRLAPMIVTTRLGEEAGAASVPNVLGRADTYAELAELAADAGLGSDLVVQTPYGDSGKTTFFIKEEGHWARDAENMVGEEIKIMKRINNRAAAVEAVNTRHGTVVGPFMTDLTGYPELTPYKGGWCGNDLFPEALSEQHRATAVQHVRRLGDRLRQEGYRGFFEVDVLVDLASDEVYLGELNPRISGASSMTNTTAGAYADIPLFLFHLLEFMDVDYEVDIDEINERWR